MNTTNDIHIAIPWVATEAPIQSGPGARDSKLYLAVIDQFEVETNPRYASRDGKTYCNIFAWDVTRAMQTELPHWVDAEERPTSAGAPGARRLDCNSLVGWLYRHGPSCGWMRTTKENAQIAADGGHPTIAILRNAAGNGHLAVLLPQENDLAGAMLSQAGAVRFARGNLLEAFGHHVPEFWTHR